jgi:hypothetical protein
MALVSDFLLGYSESLKGEAITLVGSWCETGHRTGWEAKVYRGTTLLLFITARSARPV